VETLILVAMVLSLPNYIWNTVLGHSGYKLKRIAALISAAKQTTGHQRTANLEELRKHLETSRRYHRLHWTFDEDLRRRLSRLK